MTNIILHPAVLTRPDWLDVLDQIEADCGRIVTGDNTYAEIISNADINHIEAQVTV